jgi:hypothetical protein
LLTGQPGSRFCRSAKAAGATKDAARRSCPKLQKGRGGRLLLSAPLLIPVRQVGWVRKSVGRCRPGCRRASQTARFCCS